MSEVDDLEVESNRHPLQLLSPPPLTQHPVAVYLSQLRPKSQLTMRDCLNRIALVLTQGCCDALTLDWS